MSVKIVKQKEEFSDSIAKAVQGITLNQLAVRDNRIDTEVSIKGVTIPAIATGIGGTIVDWDIYDDADSPDGGAWRKKTSHTSWYNETLNTSTRGSTRGFPARALVVAEAAKVTIYDITKGKAEMWMVFNSGNNNKIRNIIMSSLAVGNGAIAIGSNGGVIRLDFISDNANQIFSTNRQRDYVAGLGATEGLGYGNIYTAGGGLVSDAVNDVAITFLPDAPLDEYGMKVPTIAVATAGGVSIIKDDGNIVNEAHLGDMIKLSVNTNHRAFWSRNGYSTKYSGDLSAIGSTFTANTTFPSLGAAYSRGTVYTPKLIINASSSRLEILAHNPTTPAHGMVAYLTNTYNTGYMVGDTRRCYLANSLTADRSVKAGTLTVNGTITETVNAGGVNVYSGFSATNYLSEASHADWNAIGTGDFSIIMSGVKWGSGAILSMGDGLSQGSLFIYQSSGVISVYMYTTSLFVSASANGAYTDTMPHVVEIKRLNSVLYIVVDGDVRNVPIVGSYTISNTTGFLKIGDTQDLDRPWVGGQVACVRISATAPTAEQSKYIAKSELELFRTGAKSLLSNSASVSDLRYDKATDLYAVENGTNVDVFSGLQRVASKLKTSQTFDNDTPITTISGNVLVAPAADVTDKKVKVTQPNTTALFSGDGALLSFALLPGRKPISVWVGGSKQIKGATGDYTVAFDGFIYSVVFAVAPAIATNNIQVEGAAT